MTRDIPIRPLEPLSFRPFGEVVSKDSASGSFEINSGLAVRHLDVANIDTGEGDGRVHVSIFAVRQHPNAFEIGMLERHPLASQMFFPLQPTGWIVIVARSISSGEPGDPVAFRPLVGQGVNIARGVWHYPLVSQEEARFLVIDGGVAERNLEVHRFDPPRWRVASLRCGAACTDS